MARWTPSPNPLILRLGLSFPMGCGAPGNQGPNEPARDLCRLLAGATEHYCLIAAEGVRSKHLSTPCEADMNRTSARWQGGK